MLGKVRSREGGGARRPFAAQNTVRKKVAPEDHLDREKKNECIPQSHASGAAEKLHHAFGKTSLYLWPLRRRGKNSAAVESATSFFGSQDKLNLLGGFLEEKKGGLIDVPLLGHLSHGRLLMAGTRTTEFLIHARKKKKQGKGESCS